MSFGSSHLSVLLSRWIGLECAISNTQLTYEDFKHFEVILIHCRLYRWVMLNLGILLNAANRFSQFLWSHIPSRYCCFWSVFKLFSFNTLSASNEILVDLNQNSALPLQQFSFFQCPSTKVYCYSPGCCSPTWYVFLLPLSKHKKQCSQGIGKLLILVGDLYARQ